MAPRMGLSATPMIVVHNGIVWAYQIKGGWFWYIKGFPEAIKKIGKGDKAQYVPDPEHPTVLAYEKKNAV